MKAVKRLAVYGACVHAWREQGGNDTVDDGLARMAQNVGLLLGDDPDVSLVLVAVHRGWRAGEGSPLAERLGWVADEVCAALEDMGVEVVGFDGYV